MVSKIDPSLGFDPKINSVTTLFYAAQHPTMPKWRKYSWSNVKTLTIFWPKIKVPVKFYYWLDILNRQVCLASHLWNTTACIIYNDVWTRDRPNYFARADFCIYNIENHQTNSTPFYVALSYRLTVYTISQMGEILLPTCMVYPKVLIKKCAIYTNQWSIYEVRKLNICACIISGIS